MTDSIQPINCGAAPPPGGHYSQAIVHGNYVYLSGQLPVQLDGSLGIDLDFESQVRLVMRNADAVLESAGSGLNSIVNFTAYIVGVENWPEFNRVYADIMGDWRPARTVVPVPELHYGLAVEINAIAVKIAKHD